jgi:predicted aspartyl protease
VILIFPYRRQPDIDPSPAAPDEPVFRPKIPLRFVGPRGDHWLTLALVDTGADEAVVPLSAARALRVELDSKIHALYGADDRPIQVRYGVVELTIADGESLYRWDSKVAFQARRRYSVLGRAGCLDHLSVNFDGPNRRVIITTPDPSTR